MQDEQQTFGDASDASIEASSRRRILHGEVVFASVEEQSQRSAELLGAGALVVTLPPPTHAARGRLGEILEELVERELARMGAPSPYLSAWTAMPDDAQERLADQLFRARTVGATGLAIAMGSLNAIAAPTLTLDDSATLRWLATTTQDAPLVLLVDDADVHALGYAAPVPLSTLLATQHTTSIRPARRLLEPTPVEPEIELTGDDATVNETRVALITEPTKPEASARPVAAPLVAAAVDTVVAAVDTVVAAVDTVVAAASPSVTAPEPVAAKGGSEPAIPPRTRPRGASRRVNAGVPVSGPNDAWRSWVIALSGAKGAQPLAAFERLFAESYMPLSNAIAGGLDDPRAVRAYDEFRRSFERSYTDAFATFGATNRRPRLVMDAYDLAAKQARLSNARSAHVLVVDSMRFDLGCMIRDALGREATGIATLTSEVLLWSALPTTTMRQLETLARGLDALRAPAVEEPFESLRGRAAEVVRRARVGSRELYKLDLIPAMLQRKGHDFFSSLPEIAEATAEAIARHVSTLHPRTLLFVVGDHGFVAGRHGEIQTGGASPEEVLVPAFSWLIGELH